MNDQGPWSHKCFLALCSLFYYLQLRHMYIHLAHVLLQVTICPGGSVKKVSSHVANVAKKGQLQGQGFHWRDTTQYEHEVGAHGCCHFTRQVQGLLTDYVGLRWTGPTRQSGNPDASNFL